MNYPRAEAESLEPGSRSASPESRSCALMTNIFYLFVLDPVKEGTRVTKVLFISSPNWWRKQRSRSCLTQKRAVAIHQSFHITLHEKCMRVSFKMVDLVEDLSMSSTEMDFVTQLRYLDIGGGVSVLSPESEPVRSIVIHVKCRSYPMEPNIKTALALASAEVEEFTDGIIYLEIGKILPSSFNLILRT